MTIKKTLVRRALSLLLTLLMVLSLVPVSILSVSAAADTSAYAPTRRENYYNDDDAIFANGTAITIEEAPNGTRIWYMSGSTKTYVTANGENGEDLSEWRIFAGSNNQDGMSGVNGSITMTGGTVNRIYAGQHYGGFSGISNITILGGTVKEAIVCNSRAMVSSNDYINTVNIFDVTGATISTAGGKADNVVQKKGTVWNVSGNGVVPSGFTITVNEGETLTVPAGSTLTNNGTIVNNGGTIKLYGQLKGNTPQGYAPLSDVSLSTEAVPANSSTTLTATLTPADNVIMPVVSYELIDAGTTGAVLNGTNLSVYSEGTVKIKVTVSDGYCTPVEKIFAIPVTFTKVTDITGNVPTESWVNVSNTLPAMTVTPDNASYKALTWSVLNAGTTGAQINGNKLIATNSGTATIRATVANGLAYGTDFVKDYTVTFKSTDKLDISVGSITISKKDDSTLTVSYSGFEGGSKDYAADEPIEITGSTTANNIVVESGIVANIVLNNVEIIGNDKLRAIEIKSGAEADITLLGENTLTGLSGIYINSNSKATIGGTGVLNATTLNERTYGAIGGLGEGEIVVNSGTITATGENTYNSGIVGTKITINDGIVSATAGSEGVGIGSRRDADYATDVIINGGTVTASGSTGIGGGYNSDETFSVTINDGIVTTKGRGSGAGIGGGYYGVAGKVIINGGIITATNTNSSAGIGGAMHGKAVDVTINGGTVTSTKTGNGYGAAIGGGYNAETGNIIITGGNIKADSGSTYSEDIGKGYYPKSEGTITDGKGNNVYLNIITLEGASEQKAVTEVKGVENYGLNDVKTLDTNMLYFYLPETDNLNSLYLENDLYTGALTGTTEKIGTFTLHTQHNFENGFCTVCGEECEHNFENSICTICGKSCGHNFENGTCTICGKSCEHNFENGFCTVCDAFEPATDENEDGVYEIGNAGQLYWFADKVNNDNANFGSANAILTADIVVNEGTMSAESEGARVWTPIGNFNSKYSGSFDGNNKTVSGLYLNESSKWYVGLFGFVYNGTVKNTGVINSYFCGSNDVGAIAGICNSGEIINCYNESIVVGNSYTGGVVGYNEDSTMTDCYNSGNVSGNHRIAGVVGFNQRSIISNTYNTGVIGTGECVGGIVGESDGGAIESCYNAGEIIGRDTYRVGGIIGQNRNGSVDNCYNIGTVDGTDSMFVGGIAGNNIEGTITNCYYLNTACEGGIDGSDLAGSAEAKTAEQFASGEVAYLLQGEQTEDVWGQKIGTDTAPVLGGDKVYYGYTSCAYDSEMVYTNTEASDEKPVHKELRAEFDWNTPYGGECYVDMELYCTECGSYVDSDSGYAAIKETVEAQDCMHDGYELYEITLEYKGVTYTDTKKFTLKSDNHIGEVVNGFCSECGGYQKPEVDPGDDPEWGYDDVYLIYNAGQLYWFADYINNVSNDAYAKLAADIVVNETLDENPRVWTPIMDFYGNFDGNCHTVSGLYVKSEEDQIGMFGGGYYSYGTVENLGLINSYFEGNDNVGGIAGYHAGTIKNCYVTDTVTVVGNNLTGTLVGNAAGTVSNCYAYASTLVGSYNSSYATVENCYYIADTDDGEGGKTAEQFKSGEVAYLLQSGVVGEEIWDDELGEYVQTEPEHIWGQKIGTDELPTLGGDKVYYGYASCADDVAGYTNNSNVLAKRPDHNYVNGFCKVCDAFEPATLNEDGVYEIANAGQLYWFADKVNNDNANFGSADAILTADIVVNEGVMTAESEGARVWIPIGNYSNSYTGTFDGNNYTVSGLYFNNSDTDDVGLFGYIGRNSTVKNTGVINSYFYGCNYVGGVVGHNYYGTITNCYNSGSVSGTDYVGGLVGSNARGTIDNSYNAGSVSGTDRVGGLVGFNTSGATIGNCYNEGSVSGTDSVGGVVGYNNGTIANCYNTGEVSGSNEVGGVVGYNNVTITNCYYLDTTCTGGIYGEDVQGSAEAKTAEQFASGEVAYLLQGEQEELVWGQKIGTDELPVLGGDKVYTVINCKDEVAGYSNTEGEILDHNFEDGFCTVCGDMDGIAQVKGYSISLGGNIAVNYFMVLSDEVLADENAEMVFTVPNGGSTYEVRIPVSSVTPDANGYYVFICEVAAKEMTSKIAAQIVTGDKESDVFEYSVKQYAEYILAKAEEANSLVGGGVAGGIAGGDGASNLLTPEMLSYVKAAPLVKAMLNYGANAQLYFDYNTDNLANDTELMTEEEKTVELYGFAGAPFTLEGEETGVTYYGTALSLETELAFKHYFIIDESVDIQNLEITCDYPVTLKKNGSFYELIISDIPAHKMGEGSLKVSLGGITLDYTIYSYGALAQNSGNEELWTVVSALAHFAGEATMYAYK